MEKIIKIKHIRANYEQNTLMNLVNKQIKIFRLRS